MRNNPDQAVAPSALFTRPCRRLTNLNDRQALDFVPAFLIPFRPPVRPSFPLPSPSPYAAHPWSPLAVEIIVCNAPRISGGIDDCIICRDPASVLNTHRQICHRRAKSARINPDHNLDRNGADDGPDASGASDIRRRDDNSGDSRPRRSSKVCLAGIRG
jgi:hypothetical protein